MAVQFFVASLVVWSSLPGALVFSLFVLFTAAFHGHVHCVTLSEPLMAFGTVLVSLGALALRPDAAHIHVFSILIPSAVTLEILAGSIEKGRRQAVAETARLRAAVAAQILDRQDEEVRRLSQKLVDLLAYNHDVNNALMSARLAAEGLSTLLETGGVPASRDLTILAADLGSSLNQVDGLLRQAREAGTMKAASTAEGVELLPVMFEVASQIGARFPAIRITVPATLPRQRVGVRGGALSLHRILHNLALNACEGNGRDRARNVLLTFERNSTGASVDIRVIDDGPGFSADTLGRPIEGFETSKLHGTGLGLYTSERLVRASGGTLTRANQPEGGAVVCVTLPVEAA
jgi:signal transduction histidine kinase